MELREILKGWQIVVFQWFEDGLKALHRFSEGFLKRSLFLPRPHGSWPQLACCRVKMDLFLFPLGTPQMPVK